MTHRHLLRLCLGLIACLAAAGCGGVERYGKAANYDFGYQPKIAVRMPPNAPYMSAQFFKGEEFGDGDHQGIDIWGRLGAPVIAAAPGRVVGSYYEPAYGNRVVIDHGLDETGARVRTVYKHLHDRLAKQGDAVARGQQIGTMGATGALGMMVHLHFEVRRDLPHQPETAFDPNLFWIGGPGKVTCFETGKHYPERPFRTTYPVPCRRR